MENFNVNTRDVYIGNSVFYYRIYVGQYLCIWYMNKGNSYWLILILNCFSWITFLKWFLQLCIKLRVYIWVWTFCSFPESTPLDLSKTIFLMDISFLNPTQWDTFITFRKIIIIIFFNFTKSFKIYLCIF